ncbi:MAG: hypothetical protein Q9162_002992 [Coniocarpon cinnabarinum]
MAENDAVQIDSNTFHDRLASFLTAWKNDKRAGDNFFNGASSLILLMGKSEEASGFFKNGAFQLWLLGYEFPATLMLFTLEQLFIVTTKKKAAYLDKLQGGKTPVEILIRSKDSEENAKQFEKCTEAIKAAGKKVAVLNKVPASGPFADEWKQAYDKVKPEIEEVEAGPSISSAALTVKSENELRTIRDASRASCHVLVRFFYEELSRILDEEQKVSHAALSDKVNKKIDDNKFWQKLKGADKFDSDQIDWAQVPLIQSGGSYDLTLKSAPASTNLHAGTIIASMGLRYNSYSSFVARTYLVDPNKSQDSNYKFLLEVRDIVLKEIKDGVKASQVWEKAYGHVQSKKPELAQHMRSSVGFGIGIESKDTTLNLNAKSSRVLKDGTTVVVSICFQDLENPKPHDKKSNPYALLIADTVRVTSGEAVVFTKDAGVDDDSVIFSFAESEDEKRPRSKKESRPHATAASSRTRLRHERATNQNAEKEEARTRHQKELHKKKQEDGLERFPSDTGAMNGSVEKRFKKFESYKRDNQLPSKVKELVVCVDERAQSVVLPIMGHPVPFHINTIKNASTTVDPTATDGTRATYLRINFLSPGQGVGRKDDQPFEDPNAHFVRSLTFKSYDVARMEQIATDINNLQKASKKREAEKKEMEDVVEQDKLVEIRNRRPHRNEPVFIRPNMEGKRLAGAVEIHQNGLRYNHPGQQRVDILFSNVKHLFFQPCDHELIVIIHVHLINPIIIGKRKTKDVQFYRDATEMAFDETGNRKRKHRYGDEEEFEQEQEERRRRAALNKEFKAFAEKIADAGRDINLAVDIPFRELGFHGVPARSAVLIQPTTDCLIQLTEPPFLVVTLSEIEVVHLERVQFGLKNFDMVLVMHDFNKAPVHINTIPVESLDAVKDWLDSVDIPFSEGPLNLNWAQIMKTVTADPHAFFADGGWNFLSTDSDDEEGGQESSEQESAFEMSDGSVAELSEESSEEDSEFDEDASAEEEGSEVSEPDDGEDWDELEEKAKKKDKVSGLEKEDKPKKRR